MEYALYQAQGWGWLSKRGQYTTDYKEAAWFSREEAVARAKKSKLGSTLTLIPVEKDIVAELTL